MLSLQPVTHYTDTFIEGSLCKLETYLPHRKYGREPSDAGLSALYGHKYILGHLKFKTPLF